MTNGNLRFLCSSLISAVKLLLWVMAMAVVLGMFAGAFIRVCRWIAE